MPDAWGGMWALSGHHESASAALSRAARQPRTPPLGSPLFPSHPAARSWCCDHSPVPVLIVPPTILTAREGSPVLTPANSVVVAGAGNMTGLKAAFDYVVSQERRAACTCMPLAVLWLCGEAWRNVRLPSHAAGDAMPANAGAMRLRPGECWGCSRGVLVMVAVCGCGVVLLVWGGGRGGITGQG